MQYEVDEEALARAAKVVEDVTTVESTIQALFDVKGRLPFLNEVQEHLARPDISDGTIIAGLRQFSRRYPNPSVAPFRHQFYAICDDLWARGIEPELWRLKAAFRDKNKDTVASALHSWRKKNGKLGGTRA